MEHNTGNLTAPIEKKLEDNAGKSFALESTLSSRSF